MMKEHGSEVRQRDGGSNAGHTVKTDKGTFKLHLVPSGILNDSVLCVIGALVMGGATPDQQTLADPAVPLKTLG